MYTINCKGKLLTLQQPVVMGILNITSDSFYTGFLGESVEAIVQRAGAMLQAGAAILDVGGQSTRPNSTLLSALEEAERVVPVIAALHAAYPDAVISVDTFYAAVAEAAVNTGASMVNDVSGGQMDASMLATVGSLQVPYVCMHMKGTPATMQQLANYTNVTEEVITYFVERLDACNKAGIKDVIIDPGFGFAKNAAHNFKLLQQLQDLQLLGKPILAGLSRKSTVYKTLGITAAEALNGTTVLNTIALLNGASLLRVHDVKEAMEAVALINHYQQA